MTFLLKSTFPNLICRMTESHSVKWSCGKLDSEKSISVKRSYCKLDSVKWLEIPCPSIPDLIITSAVTNELIALLCTVSVFRFSRIRRGGF